MNLVYSLQTLCLERLTEVVNEVFLVLDTDSYAVESAVEFLRIEVHSLVVLAEEHDKAGVMSQRYSRCENIKMSYDSVVEIVLALQTK